MPFPRLVDHTKLGGRLNCLGDNDLLINLATKFFFRSRLLFLFLNRTWWNIKEEIFNVWLEKDLSSTNSLSLEFLKMSSLRSRLNLAANQVQGDRYVTRCKWEVAICLCLCGVLHNILYSYIASKVYFVVHDSCR